MWYTSDMAPSPKVLAVRLHLPDVDQAFPEFFAALETLQIALSKHLEMDEIRPMLRTVATLAMGIFRREEEAMELTRDRMMLPHRTAHQRFLRALAGFQKALEEDGPSVAISQDYRRDIVDWIFEHHLLMDAALGRHVQAVVERSLDRISRSDP